jgi:hypothetical protein
VTAKKMPDMPKVPLKLSYTLALFPLVHASALVVNEKSINFGINTLTYENKGRSGIPRSKKGENRTTKRAEHRTDIKTDKLVLKIINK